jgi:hypothetical protein
MRPKKKRMDEATPEAEVINESFQIEATSGETKFSTSSKELWEAYPRVSRTTTTTITITANFRK